MQSTLLLLTALVSLAGASPLESRQLLDFGLLDETPDPASVSVPVGLKSQTTTYDLPAATSAAASEPLQDTKRDVSRRSACDPQPAGSGPSITPDTSEAFLDSTELSDLANGAVVPDGYVNTYTNLQASSGAYGYSGFTTLDSYDVAECASQCNDIDSCSGFNIYFERDPTLEPAPACPDPASTTVIKCVFWGGYVGEENAKNTGQGREDFQIVVAGSNGYMKTRVPAVSGFDGVAIGNNAVNAPLNCLGEDTFMGSKVFSTSYFDPNLCAAACASQNEYNIANPPATGSPKICRYFVTFLAAENGNPQGQYCSLYTQAWDKSYATNDGQYRGDDHYTNTYGFAYTNSECSGNPACPKGSVN